ncbi:MAG: restriction endonuclease [Armatimonadota bacterium]|nr:restriction endonuclease [Armatimonadota bacterium]
MTSSKKNGKSLLNPHWKDFEQLVAEIHRQLLPYAEVIHNHHIKGASGEVRQLDVYIVSKEAYYPIRIAIECKRERRRVSIEEVDSLRGKKTDIGVDYCVMVSSVGFTRGATRRAAICNIQLLTLKDAQSIEWTSFLSQMNPTILKTYLDFNSMDVVALLPFGIPGEFEGPMSCQVAHNIQVSDSDGSKLFVVSHNMYDHWETLGYPPSVIGVATLTCPAGACITVDGKLIPVERFIIRYKIIPKIFKLDVPLGKGDTLAEDGSRRMKFRRMTSEWINTVELVNGSSFEVLSDEEYALWMKEPDVVTMFVNPSKDPSFTNLKMEVIQKPKKGQVSWQD